MTDRRVRVLVVDDSAFARKVLRETLAADPRIEVVGYARDGLEALERITELRPDVVTLDLVMPNLDGIGVLRALPAESPPRVVVVSMADDESEIGVAALAAGALDVVHKPTALATERLYELRDELVAKVVAAGGARSPSSVDGASVASAATASSIASAKAAAAAEWGGAAPGWKPDGVTDRLGRGSRRVLVIGASTGGPQALTRLVRGLPASFPVPVAIVLHMPVGYTSAFAQRLDGESAVDVVEASEGLLLRPGLVVIGRAGLHFKLVIDASRLVAHLDAEPSGSAHVPSVDALFESAANAGAGTLALVLTGMGDDGTAGARAIRARGGAVLTEAESSCVVYGMPRAVCEAGLSDGEAPLSALPDLIRRHL